MFARNVLKTVMNVSHSVWSAWIEIKTHSLSEALNLLSHSVWSAWIEIHTLTSFYNLPLVALRLECVDRNLETAIIEVCPTGRTPFGVRG